MAPKSPGDLRCYNIADLRDRARRRLPLGIWEYAERGVEDECGMARNRAAFEAVTFRPRVLRGVQKIDPSTEIFGKALPFPLAVAPTGAAGLLWHKGDLALARAAAAAGVPFVISSASTMDLEQIAEAGGRQWFQLYLWEDRALSHGVVERAWTLGCEALFVTLDLPVPPNREYIQRNGFGTPFKLNARNTLDVLTHPRCINCHPATRSPTQGEDMHPHVPLMIASESSMGPAGLACTACHGPENRPIVGSKARFMAVPRLGRWQKAGGKAAVGEISRLLGANRPISGNHDDFFVRGKLHHLSRGKQLPRGLLA